MNRFATVVAATALLIAFGAGVRVVKQSMSSPNAAPSQTAAQASDPKDVFYRQPVYMLNDPDDACRWQAGVPAGISEDLPISGHVVEKTQKLLGNGKALEITVKRDVGGTDRYAFFLDKDSCEAALQAMTQNSATEDDASAFEDAANGKTIPLPPLPSQWWVATLNHDSCMTGTSPADKIRDLQGAGEDAQTSDTTDAYGRLASVEVSYDSGNGQETYWTFFHVQQDCLASLPVNHPVSSEYE